MAEDPLAIGLKKDAAAMQSWLNSWVASNEQNGRLNAIWKQYFGIDISRSVY